MRKLSSKLLLLAAGALLLLFLTNNFGLIDIQKTAIVTAIGIDAGEGGTFDVTAQIAIPDAGGANTASNVTVPGAETVGEAIAELNRKTGWFPTLVHCSLILLGERAAEEDVFRALDYFLRSEYVEDSCLVALCADTAAAALGAGSPIGELASSAIAKVLSAEAQKTGLVSVTNLRDFAKGYFAEGQSGFLPTLFRGRFGRRRRQRRAKFCRGRAKIGRVRRRGDGALLPREAHGGAERRRDARLQPRRVRHRHGLRRRDGV